jgi:pantothenate kinase
VLGIAGLPGGGKSTLAEAVVERLAPLACYVPMDGFHLSNAELARLGRGDRKGAPDTFDAAGYVALLRRLRAGETETVYAPAYDRTLEEAVAAAVAVQAEVPLVVTEGNYLLLEEGAWSGVRPQLDEVWYVEADETRRLEQLLRRHISFGKTPQAAHAWVHGSDQRNAEVVARTRHRADLVVHLRPAHSREPPATTTHAAPAVMATGTDRAGHDGAARTGPRTRTTYEQTTGYGHLAGEETSDD